MATPYQFAYRLLGSPTATLDGSGQVHHNIDATFRIDGSGDNFKYTPSLPGHHKTFVVPAAGLAAVMDMPDGTGPELNAKNTAYKQLLAANKDTSAQPMNTNWNDENFQAFMDANDSSTMEAARANEYITVTLGQTYPVPFQL